MGTHINKKHNTKLAWCSPRLAEHVLWLRRAPLPLSSPLPSYEIGDPCFWPIRNVDYHMRTTTDRKRKAVRHGTTTPSCHVCTNVGERGNQNGMLVARQIDTKGWKHKLGGFLLLCFQLVREAPGHTLHTHDRSPHHNCYGGIASLLQYSKTASLTHRAPHSGRSQSDRIDRQIHTL